MNMAKTLVVVESPAKAKTINKFLGQGYIVKACNGHVRDLPKNELGVDIENDFAPTYVALKEASKPIKDLKDAAGKVERSPNGAFLKPLSIPVRLTRTLSTRSRRGGSSIAS
jgi:reverse gyrase